MPEIEVSQPVIYGGEKIQAVTSEHLLEEMKLPGSPPPTAALTELTAPGFSYTKYSLHRVTPTSTKFI